MPEKSSKLDKLLTKGLSLSKNPGKFENCRVSQIRNHKARNPHVSWNTDIQMCSQGHILYIIFSVRYAIEISTLDDLNLKLF